MPLSNATLAMQVPFTAEALDRIAALELDAIQLRIGPGYPIATGHPDDGLAEAEAAATELQRRGLRVVALGYYRNMLEPDVDARRREIDGLRHVMAMAPVFGTDLIGVFAGRLPDASIDDNLPLFEEVWRPLAERAAELGLRLAFENCTMFKGYPVRGINISHTPYALQRMFEAVDTPCLGIELDPSHLIKQRIDVLSFVDAFAERIFHLHAKDHRRDAELEQLHGCFDPRVSYDVLPGLGEVDFPALLARLAEHGYHGDVTLEVERGMLADGEPKELAMSVGRLRGWLDDAF